MRCVINIRENNYTSSTKLFERFENLKNKLSKEKNIKLSRPQIFSVIVNHFYMNINLLPKEYEL